MQRAESYLCGLLGLWRPLRPGQSAGLRAHAYILAISQALTRHAAYFDQATE
jgi:hypothetical protein